MHCDCWQVAATLGGFIAGVVSDIALGTYDRNMSRRAAELRVLLGKLG